MYDDLNIEIQRAGLTREDLRRARLAGANAFNRFIAEALEYIFGMSDLRDMRYGVRVLDYFSKLLLDQERATYPAAAAIIPTHEARLIRNEIRRMFLKHLVVPYELEHGSREGDKTIRTWRSDQKAANAAS